MPGKEEILKYADPDYTEDSPELKAVVKWVKKYRKNAFEEDIIDGATLPLIMYSDPLSAVQGIVTTILHMPDDEDEAYIMLQELMVLIAKLHNKTRMWFLRGYTPEEIEKAS